MTLLIDIFVDDNWLTVGPRRLCHTRLSERCGCETWNMEPRLCRMNVIQFNMQVRTVAFDFNLRAFVSIISQNSFPSNRLMRTLPSTINTSYT